MNIQVTHDASPNNARSESCIAINPNNPMQVVAASKKFNDIHTYDFTLATEYSMDGGQTWHDSAPLALVGFTVMTDPTMAWDDQGHIFLLGLAGTNPPTWDAVGMVVYKSTDGGQTWSPPLSIHTSSGDDKQWMAGDANPASPHHGNVYAAWDNAGSILFARTKDHGANWIGPGPAGTPAGASIISGSHYPEINVAQDGTIYVASTSGADILLHISTDGGDSFQSTPNNPATGITPLGGSLPYAGGFPVFPGGTFRVITDPTACAFGDTVLVAWADYREGVSRIYYAQSNDRGAHWVTGARGQPLLSGPLPGDFQHFHPQITVDPYGAVGCSFYEFGPKPSAYRIDLIMAQSFDGGGSFSHFTVTDQPWDPAVDAPWSHGDSSVTFIGDYMGLDASTRGFFPLWTDTRTGVQELFTAGVPERRCQLIVERSTIGQDEVDARRQLSGANAVIPDAFRVVVDGYSAAQLGIANAGTTLNVTSPSAGMTINCTGNVSASGGYGPEVQRFTFNYNIDFGADTNDPAFGFAGPTEFLTLSAAIADVSASGQIELIKQPDPYMLHGDPTWLSVDLRTFVMRPNDVKFGVQMGASVADAPNFIQHAAEALSNGNGSAGGQSFDDPAVLPPDEQHSALYVYDRDEDDRPVFNFALARVRYVGLIGAANVRVFFRLFNAQTTSGTYDYPPGHRYRRAPSNPQGHPIPLPGIQGSDYVTMPFFALPRVDTTVFGVDQQTDSHNVGGTTYGNVQTIAPHGDGSEVDTFFGCWLDINQSTPVLPGQVDTLHPDGPYQSASNPALPIQQAILRNRHQCLIAEVAFDPIAIPVGKDPSNWDKLAQRNLAWSDIGSASAVTTFEIRPTKPGLGPGQMVDELMIDWGETPKGSVATIYLPAASADEILRMAARLYITHGLTRRDAHTLQCRTGGITYVPVPVGTEVDFAGLLTIEPPSAAWHGKSFTVVVRQVTNAYGAQLKRREPEKRKPRGRAAQIAVLPGQEGGRGGNPYEPLQWRRVMGAFQLTVPVKPKQSLLRIEERTLAVLLWVAEAIPAGTRWYPVFQRYLDVIAGRVKSFGGDPGKILPSPTGWPGRHHPQGDGDHDGGAHGRPEGHGRRHDEHTGKIAGLIYDSFGDFEGFILRTKHGSHRFQSREEDIELLARRAWHERLRLSVWSEQGEPGHILSIAVLAPPVPFARGDVENGE